MKQEALESSIKELMQENMKLKMDPNFNPESPPPRHLRMNHVQSIASQNSSISKKHRRLQSTCLNINGVPEQASIEEEEDPEKRAKMLN